MMQIQESDARRDLRGMGGALLRQTLLMQLGPVAVIIAILVHSVWGMESMWGMSSTDAAELTRVIEGLQASAVELIVRLTIPLSAVFSLLGGAIIVRYAARQGVSLREGLRTLGPYRWRDLPALCVALFGLNMLSNLMLYAAEWLLNLFGRTISVPSFYQGDALSWWLTFAYVVILGPIIEEAVYRGALMGILGRYGEKFAIIASAIVFALAHGNLYQFFSTLLIGLILGYLFARSGSLKLVIVLHIANNLFATAYAEWLHPWLGSAAVYTHWFLTIGLGALGAVIFARRARALEPVGRAAGIAHPYRIFFGGGAMIAFALIYLGIIMLMVGRL